MPGCTVARCPLGGRVGFREHLFSHLGWLGCRASDTGSHRVYAGVERQDKLFSAWVLGHKCRSETGVQTLGSVSQCCPVFCLGKVLGWGVGNTYRSILQMSIDSVSSEGVGSLPSWDCLLFSLHLRVDLVYSGGVLGRVLLFFFNASSFSDDMLFFVSVSWQIISYFPCP